MFPTLERDFPWLISVSVEVTWKKIPMVLVETGSNNLGFSEVPFLSKKHLWRSRELCLSQNSNASLLLVLQMHYIRSKAQRK